MQSCVTTQPLIPSYTARCHVSQSVTVSAVLCYHAASHTPSYTARCHVSLTVSAVLCYMHPLIPSYTARCYVSQSLTVSAVLCYTQPLTLHHIHSIDNIINCSQRPLLLLKCQAVPLHYRVMKMYQLYEVHQTCTPRTHSIAVVIVPRIPSGS